MHPRGMALDAFGAKGQFSIDVFVCRPPDFLASTNQDDACLGCPITDVTGTSVGREGEGTALGLTPVLLLLDYSSESSA